MTYFWASCIEYLLRTIVKGRPMRVSCGPSSSSEKLNKDAMIIKEQQDNKSSQSIANVHAPRKITSKSALLEF